jgi:hypothetical protein
VCLNRNADVRVGITVYPEIGKGDLWITTRLEDGDWTVIESAEGLPVSALASEASRLCGEILIAVVSLCGALQLKLSLEETA